MEKCYYCERELNEANKSLEHIIPNALYGHLTSKNILCKECNNKLSRVDAVFAENLNQFFAILQIKRDRDSQKDYEKRSVKAKIGDTDIKIRYGMQIDTIATKESGIIRRTSWTDDAQEYRKRKATAY